MERAEYKEKFVIELMNVGLDRDLAEAEFEGEERDLTIPIPLVYPWVNGKNRG